MSGADEPTESAEEPADEPADTLDGLPATSCSGLASGSGGPALPLALAISIAVALGSVLVVPRIPA